MVRNSQRIKKVFVSRNYPTANLLTCTLNDLVPCSIGIEPSTTSFIKQYKTYPKKYCNKYIYIQKHTYRHI